MKSSVDGKLTLRHQFNWETELCKVLHTYSPKLHDSFHQKISDAGFEGGGEYEAGDRGFIYFCWVAVDFTNVCTGH